MVLCCLEEKVPTQFFSLVFLYLLPPDVFPQESYVLVRGIQCLSFFLCLYTYYCLELLHFGPFSSWWIQVHHEEISGVICFMKPLLPPQSARHFLFWT